jgi:hypothetical protein
VPLYPYGQRRTLRRELVPNQLWTFEQLQGILYVTVPIRMSVVRLAAGGLLVYAPVAPTAECVRLVQELEQQEGPVRYIILPTASGLEHKIFVGPFARRFPQAQVFVAPHQWSFPLNLPLTWLGLPGDRTQVLPLNSRQAPFGDEFDYAILGPINLGLGAFEEVAFFHRQSRTLLVTDAVVSVPATAPEIVELDPYPLLFHARERATDPIEDTPAHRRKGWQRIALFAFYFRPSALTVVPKAQVLREARQAPDRSRKAYFGLYPFQWQPQWQQSFEALRQGGRLVVAPILQRLILNRAPQETLAWVHRVTGWNFEQVVPCHFDASVLTSPALFRDAFAFLEPSQTPVGPQVGLLPEEDFAFLEELQQELIKLRIAPPPETGR